MKYHVMRLANKNNKILEVIQKKYFPTIPKAALGNEFMFRHFQDRFQEEIAEVERENQCD